MRWRALCSGRFRDNHALVNIKGDDVDKEQVERLAGRLNLGEVTAWRLEWLARDLGKLQAVLRAPRYGPDLERFQNGMFAESIQTFKDICLAYSKLRWEVMTMLGLEDDKDIIQFFEYLPNHEHYLLEVEETKASLKELVKRMFEENVAQQMRRIEECAYAMY